MRGHTSPQTLTDGHRRPQTASKTATDAHTDRSLRHRHRDLTPTTRREYTYDPERSILCVFERACSYARLRRAFDSARPCRIHKTPPVERRDKTQAHRLSAVENPRAAVPKGRFTDDHSHLAQQSSSGVANVRDRERTARRKNEHEQGEQTHTRTKRAHNVALHAVEVQHIDGARLGHVRRIAADG